MGHRHPRRRLLHRVRLPLSFCVCVNFLIISSCRVWGFLLAFLAYKSKEHTWFLPIFAGESPWSSELRGSILRPSLERSGTRRPSLVPDALGHEFDRSVPSLGGCCRPVYQHLPLALAWCARFHPRSWARHDASPSMFCVSRLAWPRLTWTLRRRSVERTSPPRLRVPKSYACSFYFATTHDHPLTNALSLLLRSDPSSPSSQGRPLQTRADLDRVGFSRMALPQSSPLTPDLLSSLPMLRTLE